MAAAENLPKGLIGLNCSFWVVLVTGFRIGGNVWAFKGADGVVC